MCYIISIYIFFHYIAHFVKILETLLIIYKNKLFFIDICKF